MITNQQAVTTSELTVTLVAYDIKKELESGEQIKASNSTETVTNTFALLQHVMVVIL